MSNTEKSAANSTAVVRVMKHEDRVYGSVNGSSRAILTLRIGYGKVKLFIDEVYSCDRSISIDEHDGVVVCVRNEMDAVYPDAEVLAEIAEEIEDLAARVLAGLDSEWDGNTMCGILTDDAQEALDELRGKAFCGRSFSGEVTVWDVAEWLQNEKFSANMTEAEIEELADDFMVSARMERVAFDGGRNTVLEYIREQVEELKAA